jgi:nicotinamide phosphoribosyltransferase
MKLRAATVTDGYKIGHGTMYADGTTKVYSNLTPRSDKIYLRNCTKFYDGKLVFVGAQGAVQEIKEMWDEFFLNESSVSTFATRMEIYLGGEVAATAQLRELWTLGYLPLEIKSLPEGSRVPMGVPVMTITNTLPEFFWLTNYLETVLSDLTWKTSTNATIAAEYKAICNHYAALTGVDDFTVSIQCHDFSMRGMSGPEDAARAGFAHLTSFIGTDTLPAMDYAEDYYDASGLIAISVPATEHAVATSNILKIEKDLVAEGLDGSDLRLEAELMFMDDLITRKFPTGIVSYVADSFDFWAVLTKVLPAMKDTILAREDKGLAPGKLVIRPDSGDPVKVVCGYNKAEYILHSDGKYYEYFVTNGIDHLGAELAEAEVKGAAEVLWETFGGTITDKGYKLLDSHIGLIYGDSITTKRAEEILSRLEAKGFASGNIVFGVGSYTYQCNTRDTFGFAVKATYTEVNGQGIEIFKDPKTDSKKKSAKGLLFVRENEDNSLELQDCVSSEVEQSAANMLQTIFKDGIFTKRTTLDEIRTRL